MNQNDQQNLQPEPPPKKQRSRVRLDWRSQQMRWVAAACVTVGIILLQGWAANIQAERTRDQAYSRMMNALATACTRPVLEQKQDRLKILASQIASSGGFDQVIFVNLQGVVVGSSARQWDDAELKSLAGAPEKPQIRKRTGRLILTRAITLAPGNPIGTLQIELTP